MSRDQKQIFHQPWLLLEAFILPSDQPRPSKYITQVCSCKQLPAMKAGGKIRQQPAIQP